MGEIMERITMDFAVCHGKPTIRGLRYPAVLVLDLLGSGMSVDEILDDYPDLEREDISAVLAFARRVIEVKRIDLAG